MTMARLWAPFPVNVLMIVDGKPFPMTKGRRGWWVLDSPSLVHGTDYAFVLDGSDPLPDPRSTWQPYGVHGFSRCLDHSLFPWTDTRWQPPPLSSALIYELHVGTFSPQGTFEGVRSLLDHFVNLGVTHVELMPVSSFPGRRGWGYDGVDLYAPHEPYGGPEALKSLVDACHAKGLAVILDVVYNHLGPDGNYLERFGPYFTDHYASPWGKAVNFDGPGSDEARRFFIDNALMWLKDYHMDGLRLDAVHAIVDTSAVHFLEQLSSEVQTLEKVLGRHLILIAESNLNDPRIVQPREIGGYGIHAQWNDDLHHALHAVLTGEKDGYYMDFGSIGGIAKALKEAFVYDGCYSSYRDRVHGRPVHGMNGDRFVVYLQTHDQVGNRAKGERAGELMNTSGIMAASALVFCSPYIPMIFQGEEWAASSPFQYFTDHVDEDLGRAVVIGRKNEFASFGWNPEDIPDPQAEETFMRSRLVWGERMQEPHRSVFEWYVKMILLRKSYPELMDGDLAGVRVKYDEEGRWIMMRRGRIITACNLSPQTRTLALSTGRLREIVLSSAEGAFLEEESLRLPPGSTVIIAEKNRKTP